MPAEKFLTLIEKKRVSGRFFVPGEARSGHRGKKE